MAIMGAKIKQARSTKEGKVLITTEKDEEAIKQIQQVMTQNSQAIRVRTTGANLKKVLIYVRGLDAITTKQKVAEVTGRNVDLKVTECEIEELRPGVFVTIKMEKVAAEQLLLLINI